MEIWVKPDWSLRSAVRGLRMEVKPDWTLEEVCRQAIRRWPEHFTVGVDRQPWSDWVPQFFTSERSLWGPVEWQCVVASEGCLRWHRDYHDITLAEVERTAKAGLIDIVPGTVVFEPAELGGNGGLPVEVLLLWPAFMEFLPLLAEQFARLIDPLLASIRSRWSEWKGRGCQPEDWLETILHKKERGWDVDEAARLFGVETQEAAASLVACGYNLKEERKTSYRFSPDEEQGRVLLAFREVRHEAFWAVLSEEATHNVARQLGVSLDELKRQSGKGPA